LVADAELIAHLSTGHVPLVRLAAVSPMRASLLPHAAVPAQRVVATTAIGTNQDLDVMVMVFPPKGRAAPSSD
jgi:hypothetical protein